MNKRMINAIILSIVILVNVSCQPTPQITTPTSPPPSPVPSAPPPSTAIPEGSSPVVFSEVLAGIQGNNNYEFIELYNRSTEIVNLMGWSIWYRMPSSQEDIFIYRWTTETLVPPQGHYLLGHTGQEFDLRVNAEFEQGINTFSGGVQLRQMDGTVRDALGWGSAAEGFVEGVAAPALQNGLSLERLPGGGQGSMQDNDNNTADFSLNPTPHPQNTGSPLTPEITQYLDISISAPSTVEPGSQYNYSLSVTNFCGQTVNNVQIIFPLPAGLSAPALPDNISSDGDILTWRLPSLLTGETQATEFTVDVPWTYFTASVSNYYAQADGCPLPSFGHPVYTSIEGGVIPIGTARTLLGADLTIEGTVTMYTGGYYAGGGNTKFYLQDETGGIQVQVFGGEGVVSVGIGSHVRVRGNVSTYRGAVQIVPIVVPDDVIRLDDSMSPLAPTIASLDQATADMEILPGRLVQVEGLVTRVEEFTYSYEMDLTSETGDTLTLYIDKQTWINVEAVEVGQQYRTTGILEVRDNSILLYPRIQEDLVQIFPPELYLEVEAPNTIGEDGLITYTLIAINQTSETMNNVTIQANVPDGTSLLEVLDGGSIENNHLTWIISQIAGDGSSAIVQFIVAVVDPSLEIVVFTNPNATADEWQTPVVGQTIRTFSGNNVPIWAIQGDGFRSPYVFDELTTQGVVIGVFDGLGGFYIQSISVDEDTATSEGLFISTGGQEIHPVPGDLVSVRGIVREPSNQTTLQVSNSLDVTTLSRGNPLPQSIELDPPATVAEAEVYYETVEGMLVQVSGPAIAVSPTSKYGEYVVVLTDRGISRLYQGEDNGFAIMVDDGSSVVHSDNSTMSYTITTGDQVSQLIGPLAYTYGRYKIEPIVIPEVVAGELSPNQIQPASSGEFSMMTWNVENMFDIIDPHPADPPRPSVSEYHLDLDRVASTILAAGAPTIVALQEVENIGILEDLAAHEILIGYQYQPVLIEGFDSRGIDVGYLIRGDRAMIVDVQQRDAPEGLFSRPPLVIEVDITTDRGHVTVFVINNHFTSMSGGEEATEPRRTAQAAWNVTLVQEILAENSEALVAVVGDLNSFLISLPIQTLENASLTNVFDLLPASQRYTYIYQGDSQVLDHILVTPALLDIVARVEVLHCNADFPPQAPGDDSIIHTSDHDPVVVTFSP